ncbi:hypothetical protein [[Clostridium] colinum]|uniref:hypothetical protein n=1 Tax=[Clostridium] colinum TaxID=36835 RepID=UPI002025538A|nr:hypothetical protein [[Clostridium] colinum]
MKLKFRLIKNKFAEEKGISTTTIGFGKLFLILFIFYLIFTMMNIIFLITNSREIVQSATIATVQRNYAKVYHTSRESYSGGYRPNGIGFYESYIDDTTSLIQYLTKNDKLNLVDAYNLNKVGANGEKLYAINNIKVNVNNEPIRSGTQKFLITTRYNFEYPINFFGNEFNVVVPIKVSVKHTAKY